VASRLMAFGTYDTSAHPRFGVLLDGLRAAGHDVVEVNVPLGLDTAARVQLLRQPWRLPALALRLAGRWARLGWRGRRVMRRDRAAAVLVGYLGHFDVVLARLLFPRTTIVLDHLLFAADTARDRNSGGSLMQRALRMLDLLALRCADVIVLDTAEHAELVPARRRHRTVVCPVGAPLKWFRAGDEAPQPEPGAPLRVVFFGLFTPLQGTTTIAAAVRLLAGRDDIRWTMIGRGQELQAARELAGDGGGVEWRDWVAADDLPSIVAAHDVCLGIFGSGPKALRVVPNKVFQGAAAGRAVVTSDTGPQRGALGDDAIFVPVADPAALARAVSDLADDRRRTSELARAIHDRARHEFVPTAVVAPLQEALDHAHHP
jgi:glycosyltransferase involved in cell wall biosynthesis